MIIKMYGITFVHKIKISTTCKIGLRRALPSLGPLGADRRHPALTLPYTTSMTFNTSHESNGTIVVAPRNEVDQTATVVMCHGLGDTAQGWEDVAEASSWM